MKVKLTKISRPEGLEGGLRTTEIIGEAQFYHQIGSIFEMTSEPLDKRADIRLINTSKVIDMDTDAQSSLHPVFTLKTQSGSVYKIEVLG